MVISKQGTDRVRDIAAQLDLPEWLVEALIIEYLPCRRFFEDGKHVMIDFEMVSADDVRSIDKPYILLNGVYLLHNITSEVFRDRLWIAMTRMFGITSLPLAQLAEKPYMSFAVGKVSPHYLLWPDLNNGASIEDEKLGLGIFKSGVVVDVDGIYQWELATNAIPLAQYKSDILGDSLIQELIQINQDLQAVPFPTDEQLLDSARQEMAKLYERLEVLRVDMRQMVLGHHQSKRNEPMSLAGYSEDAPPQLTSVDQFTVRAGKIKVRTYVEPLFFRAAFRAAQQAEVAATARKASAKTAPTYIAEEIEAAAESIVMSAMCLEAYINGFAQDQLPDFSEALRHMEVTTKWRIFPGLLGHRNCFPTGDQPYQGFRDLISWRNNTLAHYKHEFIPPKSLRGESITVSSVHEICNATNASAALATVRAMVRQLNECCGFDVPDWIQEAVVTGGWLSPAQYEVASEETESIGDDHRPRLQVNVKVDVVTPPSPSIPEPVESEPAET